jgi:prolyl oligopeptidase
MKHLALGAVSVLAIGCATTPAGPAGPVRAPAVHAPEARGDQAPGPPVAPVRAVTDVMFGVTVNDPYRWMEARTPEYDAWLEGQATYARRALDALPERAAFRARLEELGRVDVDIFAVEARGSRLFYRKLAPGDEKARLYVRDGQSAERVLVDPGADERLDWYEPSPGGTRVAFGLSVAGTEESVLHVVDVKTGALENEAITRCRAAHVSWLDERTFLYTRHAAVAKEAPPAERSKRLRVHLHALGADPERDPAILGSGVTPAASVADDDHVTAWAPLGARFVIGSVARGVEDVRELYAVARSALGAPPVRWTRIASRSDAITSLALHGDDLFALTLKDATHGRVVKTRLSTPDFAHASVVVPERAAVVTGIAAAKDALYVTTAEAGISALLRVPYEGAPASVELPFRGAIGRVVTRPDVPGARFTMESWTEPYRLYAFDPALGRVVDTQLMSPPPDDVASATFVRVTSKDGTEVPLSIVRPRASTGAPAPTMLEGYGAYGITLTPTFLRTQDAWLEKGGVTATCHTRGGGDFGDQWHAAGKGENKRNAVADFLACAQYLVDHGITRPEMLAATGGSAGGMLIGGAITDRPELFGAAVIRNGVLDVLRFGGTAAGPFNAPEFGSADTEDGFRALLASDAYQHVVDGVAYPAVLLTGGARDARVVTWQPAKMAARLQAASRSGRPVLLRIDYGAGHGKGETRSSRADMLADTMAFLWHALAPR